MHWNYLTMVSNQADNDLPCIAHALYRRARRRACLRRLWSTLAGEARTRADLDTLDRTLPSGAYATSSIQCVPLASLRQRVGPCADFDARFDPLTESTRTRWLGLAWAELRGGVLPPIEVVRIGAHYLVRDGHHRVSVARALGRRAIEARVTTLVARPVRETAPSGAPRSATMVGSMGRSEPVLRSRDVEIRRPGMGTRRIVNSVPMLLLVLVVLSGCGGDPVPPAAALPTASTTAGAAPRAAAAAPTRTVVPTIAFVAQTTTPAPAATPTPLPLPADRIVATISTGEQELSQLVVAEGAVWLGSLTTGKILRIDPQTNAVAGAIDVGARGCCFAISAGAIWMARPFDDSVVRIDSQTGAVVATIDVESQPSFMHASQNVVWVSTQGSGTVSRIDPATNQVIAAVRVTTPGLPGPKEIAVAAGAAWVGVPKLGAVVRIDPQTNSVAATIPVHAGGCGVGAVDTTVVWAVGCGALFGADKLERIDPQANRVVATIDLGSVVTGAALGERAVWVTTASGDLIEIDAQTNVVRARYRLPDAGAVAVGMDALWVTNHQERVVWRIRPEP